MFQIPCRPFLCVQRLRKPQYRKNGCNYIDHYFILQKRINKTHISVPPAIDIYIHNYPGLLLQITRIHDSILYSLIITLSKTHNLSIFTDFCAIFTIFRKIRSFLPFYSSFYYSVKEHIAIMTHILYSIYYLYHLGNAKPGTRKILV